MPNFQEHETKPCRRLTKRGALATIGAILGSLVLFVALMIGAAALLLTMSAHVMGALQ